MPIDKALKADGPAIVDCVVAANEMPNVPHLELGTIDNYAKAKIKETILASYRRVTEHGDSAMGSAAGGYVCHADCEEVSERRNPRRQNQRN
jgi:hypothetical protein